MPSMCPLCGSEMKQRQGARGFFLGCVRYPDCRGTRPLGDPRQTAISEDVPARKTTREPKAPEQPGPTGDLITDLRRAAGHLGQAVDILRKRAPELDALLEADDVAF